MLALVFALRSLHDYLQQENRKYERRNDELKHLKEV
jgi:hypothetical protein